MNITIDDNILNKISEKHIGSDINNVINDAIALFIMVHFLSTEDQLLIKNAINKHTSRTKLKLSLIMNQTKANTTGYKCPGQGRAQKKVNYLAHSTTLG
jgi:hypothetical protein